VVEDPVNHTASAASRGKSLNAIPFLVALAGLAVPGLGHLWLHRWARGLIFLGAVGGLALAGYLMDGQLFTAASRDPFGRLGFLADACSGVFYLLPRFLEAAGPDLSRAAGDYGTRFLASAGIVNVIGVIDAYAIASGRRD
jgi:predicted membrane channel-forming protein YqfA (hemolysin III family)